MIDKLKDNVKNYFSSGPKLIFIAMLILMCTVIVFVNSRKKITVSFDNGKTLQIVTFRSNLTKMMEDNNINLGPKDKVTPGVNSRIKDGERIFIKRAVNIEILADGRDCKIKSAEKDVKTMLKKEKIAYSDVDKLSQPLSRKLYGGMKLVITRVNSEVVRNIQSIDYDTVVQNDDNMVKGDKKVVQQGETGVKESTYKIIYEDGKQVSKDLLNEVVSKDPVKQIISVGTLGVISASRGGSIYYTKTLNARVTAYSAGYRSTGKNPGDSGYGITATGTAAVRNSNGYSSIAVDPSVIPFGTKLYIPGYGLAVAVDIGGAIKGNSIDIFFNSESEADSWGVKRLTVYFVK